MDELPKEMLKAIKKRFRPKKILADFEIEVKEIERQEKEKKRVTA